MGGLENNISSIVASALPRKRGKEKTVKSTKEKPDEANSEFLVMGESDLDQVNGLKSTVKIDCEKCHNEEGVWWTFQTRSADEPETKFYRCTKCNHTWRDYT